jgi:cobyric acid synthase
VIDRLVQTEKCYRMEMNVGGEKKKEKKKTHTHTKVMRISRQTSPVQDYDRSKTIGKCGIFQLFGSMITDNARCTCEIKSRIAMAKPAFNKKKALFTSKVELNLR